MAFTSKSAVKVTGAKEMRKLIRETGDKDLKKELREAHKAASKVVADRAKVLVPQRSGALMRSIVPQATQTVGKVKAGRATVPYAGIIHFGWPMRGIRARPFLYDASDDRVQQVRDVYEDRMKEIVKKLSA